MPTPDFSTRRIFITGDDFGLSPRVNAEIERYHRAGALHQASLIVTASHVDEAIAIAQRNPQLRVGLHLTLCDGSATRPSALTDAEGRFPRSPAAAGLRYFFCPWLHRSLREEIMRQFEKFRALGLAATYWDGHTHLHLHPVVFRLAVPIAREHGFTSTRLVREPGPRALLPWIFARLSRAAIPPLRDAGIGFPDRTFGLRDTGRMDLAAFRRAFGQAGEGCTEIYFHPGAEANPPAPDELASLCGTPAP